MVSHAVYILISYLSDHHLVLSTLFLLLACSLVYPCMTLLHLWLCLSRYFLISVSWLCLNRQTARNNCGLGFVQDIPCYVDASVVIFFVVCMTDPLCLSWKLPPAFCDLLSCWLHGWSSSGGIFLGHAVCLELLSHVALTCSCIGQAPVNKCYRLEFCIVGYFISWELHSVPCPLAVEDLIWEWYPTHLFLGIAVLSCCRMLWLHSFWLLFLLFHVVFGGCCSMSTHISMISVFQWLTHLCCQ